MDILGISCFYHDAAAALLRDGDLAAAAHEERFTRKKHDPELPRNAVQYCLSEAGIGVNDLDYLVFYDKPFIKFERMLITYLATFPRSLPSFSKAMPIWMKEKLWMPKAIEKGLGYEGEVLFAEHHQSHAASAFLPSPFEEAAILTIDGVGEWATATQGVGRGNGFELFKEIRFPHSLGLLYSAFTYYLGFKVNSAEYKVMGAAPYGEPKYYETILEHLVDLREDGSFKLNMKYFAYHYGLTMTNQRFAKLFGHPRREPESQMENFHWDMAASVQKVTEEIVLRIVRDLHERTGLPNLCMAGGVALNCVANGRIIRESPFEQLWVQPAAGDAGGALGAALFVENCVLGRPRKLRMDHAYWGPSFSDQEILRFLDDRGAPYQTLSRDEMIAETARRLDEEQAVVGWFQGRLEWGPRSLGSRSILADPRNPGELEAGQPEDQVPRELPTLRAGGPGRQGLGLVRDRPGEPLHAAGLPGQGRPRDSRRHPRRRLRAPPDGDPRHPPGVLRPARAFRSAHRLSGTDQHLLQRPGGADRLHSRGRLPLLHAHEHGRAGDGQPDPRQARSARAGRGLRLARALRAGLNRHPPDHGTKKGTRDSR